MEERCRATEDEIRERMEGSAKGRNSSVVGMKRCWFEKKSVFGVRLMDGDEDSVLLDIAISSRQVDLVFYIRRGRSFASCGCEDWAASLSHLLDSLVSVHERTRRSM